MVKFGKLAMAASALALCVSTAQAEGLASLNPDVVERLYNPEMLDPAQPGWRKPTD